LRGVQREKIMNRKIAHPDLFEVTGDKLDVRGQWRRQLMEETYSPFMESFPLPVNDVGSEIVCVDCPKASKNF
jgi:hypothetical protein